MLCDAGLSIGCVPVGGSRETEIKDYFRENAITVAYLPEKTRGFCRH
jgi:hypothetical protein